MNIASSIISFFLYVFAPSKYSLLFCNIVTILFVVQIVPFIIKKSQGNYLNFYTLFFVSFFLVNFFYPSVLYPIERDFFSVFKYAFNDDYINKGTALAQLSASSFILGVNYIRISKKAFDNTTLPTKIISHKSTTKTTVVLFLLFLLTVGSDFLKGDFIGASSVSLYILQLLECSFILAPIIFFRGFWFQQQKILFYITALGYILLFLAIGDRGPALSLIILTIGLYVFYIKRIALKYLIFFGFTGIVLMHLIGLGRTTDTREAEGNIIARGIEKSQSDSQFQSYYAITQSFVVNTRNLYVGLEYVDKNGINWGKTSVISFLAVIPYAQSVFEKLTGIELQSSASFFTELAMGKNPSYGLGTNLVADVYISFGLIGCILLFFLFGRIVEYYRKKTITKNDIYSNIIYFTLLTYSIYYPRTGLFMPLKYIIWTFVIYYLLKQFKFLKYKLT